MDDGSQLPSSPAPATGDPPPSSAGPDDMADVARLQRKLLMGAALLLALASVYAGLFEARMVQILFAAAATIALVSAMIRRR